MSDALTRHCHCIDKGLRPDVEDDADMWCRRCGQFVLRFTDEQVAVDEPGPVPEDHSPSQCRRLHPSQYIDPADSDFGGAVDGTGHVFSDADPGLWPGDGAGPGE